MKKPTPITKESLEAFGMSQPTDGTEIIFPLEKILSLLGDEGDDDKLGTIAVVVTRERNSSELALKLPTGDTIFLACESIEELEIFEKCIGSFETDY
jgi:hypothetical protein